MYWIIELNDSNIIKGDKNIFRSNCNNKDVHRIYFTDGCKKYGFYMKNGKFFKDDEIIFDPQLNKLELKPFQSKTASIIMGNTTDHNILSYNLGYNNYDNKIVMKIFKNKVKIELSDINGLIKEIFI